MKTLLPQIDTTRCTGCGWCVAACPPHVLSLQTEGWRKCSVLHDATACTGCSQCERQCPLDVITMVRGERRQPDGPSQRAFAPR